LYSIDPTGDSPSAVRAIRPVSVSWPSRGSKDMFVIDPPAISRIIVSPTARDMPRTIAAAIPESAAGNTTRSVVCIRLAPMASEPCRSASGTADSESSESEATVGMIITPSTSPAPSEL
jgi:hypothetical protein